MVGLFRYFGYALSYFHTFLLRLLARNIKIGKKSLIYYRSRIYNFSGSEGQVLIGENCRIGSSSVQNHVGMPFNTCLLLDGIGSTIKIGDKCRINGAYIHAKCSISIGNNCVITSGVNLIDSNAHETYSLDRTNGVDTPEPIQIGNNVWIGVNAIILKGTVLPDNCVIAAGSVVRGVFPPNSIIQGNPAKVVKSFDF